MSANTATRHQVTPGELWEAIVPACIAHNGIYTLPSLPCLARTFILLIAERQAHHGIKNGHQPDGTFINQATFPHPCGPFVISLVTKEELDETSQS